MIFLTLGTQLPFDRLVRALDEWCQATGFTDVSAQINDPGPDGYRPKLFPFVASLDPDAYEDLVSRAEFIVAHAGMGSIITAMSHVKPIVIMPRRASLGEHRNDHQLATVERFRSRPGIHVAEDETQLSPLLSELVRGGDIQPDTVAPFAQARLIEALRAAIME